MKKIVFSLIAGVAFTLGVLSTSAFVSYENRQTEKQEHPRIAAAIEKMKDAVEYMEKAPHDFGGHKEQAIKDTKAAIESLKLALAYRAKKDDK